MYNVYEFDKRQLHYQEKIKKAQSFTKRTAKVQSKNISNHWITFDSFSRKPRWNDLKLQK